jgi:hypothetical protein
VPGPRLIANWSGPGRAGAVCRAIWEKLPDDTDILITHGPPIGYGDLLSTGKRAGDVDLLYHIQRYVLSCVANGKLAFGIHYPNDCGTAEIDV